MTKGLIKLLICNSISVLFLSSCTGMLSDESQPKYFDENDKEIKLYARTGSEGTRTSLSNFDGDWEVFWNKNDHINVFFDNELSPSNFSLESGAETNCASFTGHGYGQSWFGFYPSEKFISYDGTYISLELPKEQNYVKNSFCSGSYPMIAAKTSDVLRFKNLCSTIKLQLKGHHIVDSIIFTANNKSTYVCGKAKVTADFKEYPSLNMEVGGSRCICLNTGSIVLDQNIITDFYIVLPAQTYKDGFSLTIHTPTGTMTKSTSEDITLERSKIHPVSPFYLTIDNGFEPSTSFEGSGSIESPYQIKNVEDLAGMAVLIKKTRYYCFSLENDIDLSGYYGETIRSWKPIDSFSGHLEGNGHTISSLYIGKGFSGGLFNYAGLQGISNLTISGTSYSGALLAGEVSGAVLDNCHTFGKIVSDAAAINENGRYIFSGGLTNDIISSVVKNCTNHAEIKSENNSGGISGYSRNATIYNCANYGIITANSAAGGICGKIDGDNSIINCLNAGDIYHSIEYGGGIFGTSSSTGQTVKNCVNTGSVRFNSGTDQTVGGIGGYSVVENVSNCYWLYDPQKNLGTKNCMKGTYETCFALTEDEINGIKAASEILYTDKRGISTNNILNALNNWARDNSNDNEYWGWHYDNSEERINFTGKPAIAVDEDNTKLFLVSPSIISLSNEEGTFIVIVKTGVEHTISSMSDWISMESNSTASDGKITIREYQFRVQANTENKDRKGTIEFRNDNGDCATVCVNQASGSTFKSSTDYSRHKELTKLQSASKGEGINIIITGDAFSDEDQNTFDSYSQRAVEAMFAVEPLKSLQDRFNVYRLNAVSKNGTVAEGAETTFYTWFGEDTYVGGENEIVFSFVKSALPDIDLTKSLVVVLINVEKYAGTCHMKQDNSAIAYVPLQTSHSEFDAVFRHEAVGHGFGKLDDEYSYGGAVTDEHILDRRQTQDLSYGFWENIDFTSNPIEIKWSRFISDPKYSKYVWVYEGGSLFDFGVWRPSPESIMRHNNGCFNAPSREAIFKKAMRFSEGKEWEYDYDEFVIFDTQGRIEEAAYDYSSANTRNGILSKEFVTLHPPVLMTE